MSVLPQDDQLHLLDSPGDAIDLDATPAPVRQRGGWGSMLGWSATSAPVALLLLTGIALGPLGINLMTAALTALLDPVIPVALGALGVLVGLGLGDRRSGEPRLIAAALAESGFTLLIVALGSIPLAWTASTAGDGRWRSLALASGICAATSLTLPTGGSLDPRASSTRIRELGVVLPIVAGAVLLAWLDAGVSAAAIVLLANATGITLLLAGAGWLLLTQASSETEERVFAVSALLMVGGVADALSMSALFGGLTAGVFWRYLGQRPRETITRDVLFVQHPLVVLVLLEAGARADLSWASAGIGLGYVAFRMVGKLAGGLIAWRTGHGVVSREVGLLLLPPGVFGVAFALNVAGSVGSAEASLLLGAVVIATIGSDLVALALAPRRAVA
jgi:hypothetical protein